MEVSRSVPICEVAQDSSVLILSAVVFSLPHHVHFDTFFIMIIWGSNIHVKIFLQSIVTAEYGHKFIKEKPVHIYVQAMMNEYKDDLHLLLSSPKGKYKAGLKSCSYQS